MLVTAMTKSVKGRTDRKIEFSTVAPNTFPITKHTKGHFNAKT